MSTSWESVVATVFTMLGLAVVAGQGVVLNGLSAIFIGVVAIVGFFALLSRKR